MKNLTVNVSMTTVEIAELTGKQHKNVLRDTRNMLIELHGEIGLLTFEQSYVNSQNKRQPCYRLPKNEVMCLVSGYSIPLRMAIIKRLEELESGGKKELTPAEMMLENAKLLVEQERRVNAIAAKQDALEAKLDAFTSASEYYSVKAYCIVNKLKVDSKTANTFGKKASKICRENGYSTGTVPDPQYGTVKTYPESVLADVIS